MSNFEWVSSVISSLSLITTIFFGSQVYKLSKQANNIAQSTLNFQMEINKDSDDLKKQFNKEKIEEISELVEKTLNLNKSVEEIKESMCLDKFTPLNL